MTMTKPNYPSTQPTEPTQAQRRAALKQRAEAHRQHIEDITFCDQMEESVVRISRDEIRYAHREKEAGLTAHHDAVDRMRRVFEVTEILRREDDARLAAALGETVGT